MLNNSTTALSVPSATRAKPIELTCRCDSMAALRAAVDNGADWIHIEYRHDNADEIGGLNLNCKTGRIAKAIRYAHDHRCKVILASTTRSTAGDWLQMRNMIDRAAAAGVDALALADPALLVYCAAHHSNLRLHYVLPKAAAVSSEAISFLHRQFGITRVVLPELLSLPLLEQLAKEVPVELAVCGQGRFLTAIEFGSNPSPINTKASSSPPIHLCTGTDMEPVSTAIAHCANGESAANDCSFTKRRPSDSNTLRLLPQLAALGIRAVWTAAPNHAPPRLAQVTRVWREAIDNCLENLDHYAVKPSWIATLGKARREFPYR